MWRHLNWINNLNVLTFRCNKVKRLCSRKVCLLADHGLPCLMRPETHSQLLQNRLWVLCWTFVILAAISAAKMPLHSFSSLSNISLATLLVVLATASRATTTSNGVARGPPRPTCQEGWFGDPTGTECEHIYTRRPLTRQEALDHCGALKGELVHTQTRDKAVRLPIKDSFIYIFFWRNQGYHHPLSQSQLVVTLQRSHVGTKRTSSWTKIFTILFSILFSTLFFLLTSPLLNLCYDSFLSHREAPTFSPGLVIGFLIYISLINR